MRKIYLLLGALLLCSIAFTSKAQTPTYSLTFSPAGNANSFPFNSSSSNKVQWVYSPADFPTAFLGNITNVYFHSGSNPSGTTTFTNLTIKMGYVPYSTFPTGTYETGLTTVFSSPSWSPAATVTQGSWVQIPLQTPFLYDPSQNFVIEVSQTGFTAGFSVYSGALAGRRIYGSVGSATGTVGTAPAHLGFDLIPATACVAPPTAGAATVNNATPCSGGSISLNLSGNSVGSGQTYQWESSSSATGPYTSVSAAQNAAFYSTTATATSTTTPTVIYYRAAVTCNTSTVYSTPVQVTVPPLFPAGTYTIDATQPSSSSNFQSFAAAAAAINCGIAGSVVFNVTAGTYTNDQFLLEDINTSSSSTITVNGNGATISFLSTNTNERAGVRLNGTDYVTVNNLNIVATGTTSSEYGYGILLTNDADSNSFTGMNITVDTVIASTNYVPIAITGSMSSPTTAGSNSDGNVFTGNTLNGGYYGIVLYGSASTPFISDNKVLNNTIKNFYTYGVYVYGNNNTLIEGNDITRPTRTTSSTFAGVIFSGPNTNVTFTRNRIHNAFDAMTTSTSTSYPIYQSASDATAGNPNIISNNLVYDINSDGVIYGIYNSGSDHVRYYHNTISLDDLSTATSSATRGFYQTTSATGIEFINNIISIKRGGSGINHAIYKNTAGSAITANFNNYYVAGSGTNYVGYAGGNQVTLANWQTASSQDANSHELPPLFANAATGDYTPGNSSLDNMGNFVGVSFDILNVARSTSTPDIGAYEFTIPPCFGIPTAGTATINGSSSASSCLGGNLALALQGFSTGAGITFQWESSPIGQNLWGPIAGATSPTFNTSFSGPMEYRAGVTCLGATSYSNSVTATQSPFYFCYCSPSTATTLHSSTSNYVTNVEIVNTSLNSSTTTAGAGGYYQADPTVGTNTGVLSQGVPYDLITTHSSSSVRTEAWFDWDQSGTFDATEYYQLTYTSGASNVTVTPPATAVLGMTGMRIRSVFSTTTTFGASGACANISVGRETEDYVITIAPPPTCFPPSGITVSPVTSTAATVNWTAASPAPANGYDYYYSTSGTNPTSGTTPSGSVGFGILTANLTGLTPVTTYYVWVRGNCTPTDKSTWTGPETFTTACAPFTAPYTHDVESQTANTNSVMTNCWTSTPNNATGVYAWHVTGTGTTSSTNTGPSTANSGMKYFFTEASNGSAANVAVLTTPLVDVTPLSVPMLQFYYHMYGPDMNKLVVEVFNGTTWNRVDSIVGQQQTAETSPWQVRNIILTGYTGIIQARFEGTRGASFGGDISIDDISFIAAPTCPAPSNLTASTTSNSATLGWTETGSATQWQIEYGMTGFTQGTGTSVNTTTNPHNLTGLVNSTSYSFYVRSVCGANDSSAWSGPMMFATIPPNDTCANAVDITNGLVYNGTTAGATQTMASCNASTPVANDVWYSFTTGSVGGSVNVDVVTTGTMDVVMEGFSGTCAALTAMVPTASTTLTGTCIDGPAVGTEFGTYTVAPFTTYYIRVFGYVGAQGAFTIQATGTPLAIKLAGISATNVGSRNRINWTTASEAAGDYFELERSADGLEYSTIATINAKGEASTYSYWDAEPFTGKNYYRLYMKDAAGNGSYSREVTATVRDNGTFRISAHPNPVADRLHVILSGNQGNNPSITVTDVTGKVVRTMSVTGSKVEIDVRGLADGIYMVKYVDDNQTQTVKVSKQ